MSTQALLPVPSSSSRKKPAVSLSTRVAVRSVATFLSVLCLLLLLTELVAAQDSTPLLQGAWSSPESDDTRQVAWGDVEGDGDLDLAVANSGANLLYCNVGGVFRLCWRSRESDESFGIAWGDLEGDGDLDLAVGNMNAPNRLYRNDGGILTEASIWNSAESDATASVAWGDPDADGDLDLAVANGDLADQQPNRLYLNSDGALSITADWSSAEAEHTSDVAWGDFDGMGGSDLAVGNTAGQPDRVYCSQGQQLQPCWESDPFLALDAASVAWADVDGDGDVDLTIGGGASNFIYCNIGANLILCGGTFTGESARSVDWGDYDSDGDPDLAVGNGQFPLGQRVRIYRNDGLNSGEISLTNVWTSAVDLATWSVGWGDADGDGDLDLATGNRIGQPNQLFHNQVGTLEPQAAWLSAESEISHAVAWGDVNGDGTLDLAVANGVGTGQVNRVYSNDGAGGLSSVWASAEQERTFALAWGDVDGDGDLDLAIGNNGEPNRLYLNEGGLLATTGSWQSQAVDSTTGVAWGDVDGDGDLDLATGNSGQPNRLYLNENGLLSSASAWESVESDATTSIAWGDVDGDGDLDLAVGNGNGQPNRLYGNDNGTLIPSSIWSSSEGDMTSSIAWGDVDGDGDLDFAAGNALGQVNRLYSNQNGILSTSAVWISAEADTTSSIAFGDADGDGDLDLAVGNNGQPNRLYRNDGGTLTSQAVWSTADPDFTQSVAWGDANGDGRLDLAAGNSMQNRLYLNRSPAHPLAPDQVDGIALHLYANPVQTFNQPSNMLAAADHYSLPAIRTESTIELSYTIASGPVATLWTVRGSYSPDGGGRWIPANAAKETPSQRIPGGVEQKFIWDVANSSFFGRSDNVRFRLEALPVRPKPGQVPAISTSSFPFRVRGTQVRVLTQSGDAAPDARVYHLPAGRERGGQRMGSAAKPLTTDSLGYLSGRGQLNAGDRLLAVLPISRTASYTLYHTSAKPTILGLDSFQVTQAGVQTLTVTAKDPLLLFDLSVSLEWDASGDQIFLQEIVRDLHKASSALYDWTNGQVALGAVTIFQDREAWDEADVQIHASNQLRPIANRGGIVTSTTTLTHATFTEPLELNPGRIRLGPTWNRYGEPEPIREDWPRVLAHEFAHYALFLEDTYLGQSSETGLLIPVDTCSGTAMTDPYDDIFSEFRVNDASWQAECGHTLAELPDWLLMKLAYPALKVPTSPNSGPAVMPFELTTVEIRPAPGGLHPLLDDPNVLLDERLSNGRAFLLRSDGRVVELGTPQLGSVLARGAREGDEICIFAAVHAACSQLSNSGPPALEPQAAWLPNLALTPINTTTLELLVTAVQTTPITIALYPDGESPQIESLTPGITQTISLSQPAIEVWIDLRGHEAGERIMTSFTTGAGPGRTRSYGGPGRTRSYGGPIASGDSGLLIYPPARLPEDAFIVVQTAIQIPTLPGGITSIGRGYQVRVSQNITDLQGGSLAFQYIGLDALLAAGPLAESQLTVMHWDGRRWLRLQTIRNSAQNFASAPLTAPGLYVLTAGRPQTDITALMPPSGSSGEIHALKISGEGFVEPITATLFAGAARHVLDVTKVSTNSIESKTPADLEPDLYDLEITSLEGETIVLPEAFALYSSRSDSTLFADDFASGLGQWIVNGNWAIVQLDSGEEAISDSPNFPYRSAQPGALLTRTLTSQSFVISGTHEISLTVRHIVELAPDDVVAIQLSNDDGVTWRTIYSQTGQLLPVRARRGGDEWVNVRWETIQVDLSEQDYPLNQRPLRMRLTLTVDDTLSARGWLVDHVVLLGRARKFQEQIFAPVIHQ